MKGSFYMNICNGCSSKYICRIADFVNKNSNIADIVIKSCTVGDAAASGTTESVSSHSFDRIAPIQTNDGYDIISTVTAEYIAPKSYINFRDESNSLEAETLKRKRKIVSIVKETPADKKEIVICSQCSGATYEDDLGKCSVCGKDICSGCGVESIESKDRFCNECWKGQ